VPDLPGFRAKLNAPDRNLLGGTQLRTLQAALAASVKAGVTWQVLGNQTLMAKTFIPVELLILTAQLAAGSRDPALIAQYTKLLTELVTIKARLLQGDPTLTDAEKARVQNVLPYNLDAWDGYPAEREMIYAAFSGKKLISVAGDSHNAWYSVLTTNKGTTAGEEFATPSITSPGFESIFGNDPQLIAGFEQAVALLIDDVQYVDASRKGYVMAIFTPNVAKSEWRFVNTITSKNTVTITGKTVIES